MNHKQPQNIFAAIDIGTNSVHLVVAKVSDDGHMIIIDSDKVTIQLGKYLSKQNELSLKGIQKTVTAVKHLTEIAQSYATTPRIVATHATREAKNQKDLTLAIQMAVGIEVEIIDGIEEGRLTYLGVSEGFPIKRKNTLLVDIGGGSTEFVSGRGDHIKAVQSLKIGAVILTELASEHKPNTSKFAKILSEYVDDALTPLKTKSFEHDLAIASSGTAKALAQMCRKLKNTSLKQNEHLNYTLKSKNLDEIIEKILDLKTSENIAKFFDLERERTKIILAGAVILRKVSERLNVKEWSITKFGLREGVVIDSFRKQRDSEFHLASDVRWRSIKSFAHSFHCDNTYGQACAEISTKVLSSLLPKLIFLNFKDKDIEDIEKERDLLTFAAFIHEAGKCISPSNFHKHTDYLINNTSLMGFTETEKTMIGLTVKLHRKSEFNISALKKVDLPRGHEGAVIFYSSCLRIAASLNRTRRHPVIKIKSFFDKSRKKLVISIFHKPSLNVFVESHHLEKEKSVLEKYLGCSLRFIWRKERSSNKEKLI